MSWVGVVVAAVLAIIKGLFGIDKPATTEVKHEKPEKPVGVPAAVDVYRELGLRVDGRAASEDGLYVRPCGKAGGSDGEQDGKGQGA